MTPQRVWTSVSVPCSVCGDHTEVKVLVDAGVRTQQVHDVTSVCCPTCKRNALYAANLSANAERRAVAQSKRWYDM
mgnify:CR=1 FL=1